MATTSDIRNGMMIRHNHDIYQIVEFLHVKPGKGAAFVRTKLKSVTTGKVLENTFPTSAKLDDVRVERRPYSYLYEEGDAFVFMHQETFEQVNVPKTMVENNDLLLEGAVCEIVFNAEDESILKVDLPQFIEVEITYTEPGIKGDTATNTLKPATISTGAEIRVPLFVNQGDKVKIETATRSYMERVK